MQGVKAMKSVITMLFLSLLLLLQGCATSVTCEVTRYHEGAQPAGETIAIVPLDDARKGSLEFAAHANLVAEKLSELGYHVVDAGANTLNEGTGEEKVPT